MKVGREVVDVLNEVLGAEILALAQSLAHSKLAKSQGLSPLAERLRAESMDQGKHAEMLMERILFLEGMPRPHMAGTPRIGRTLTERFQNDLDLENAAMKRLNDGIATARDRGDQATADFLTRLLVDEEEHAAWLQTQLGLIYQVGEASYVLAQIGH